MQKDTIRVIQDYNTESGAAAEKGGVHFGCYAFGKEAPELLLYKKGSTEIAARLPFPPSAGDDQFYSMKAAIDGTKYEYNFCADGEVFTDPYARKICGREQFGREQEHSPHSVRGGITKGQYNWEGDTLPKIPYEDVVMYHLHVRGYTMQSGSGVRRKGTFAGLREKIPYLKSLGINQVKLMPVYEFAELMPMVPKQIKKHAEKQGKIRSKGESVQQSSLQTENKAGNSEKPVLKVQPAYKMNFWGYGSGFYFAPKSAYASGDDPQKELKDMVKAFHKNGIEVILEFYFTQETDISMITDCLSYWAGEYHIDGFAVIARESAIAEIARLPLFRTRKLICNWYGDDVRDWNRKEGHALLAESNDGFMNDCRRLLKGDEDTLRAFGNRLRSNVPGCRTINYMTNHDGFTMLDLVSYDGKHNLDNGEQNHDGTDYNFSWNCGVEGPSKKREIKNLRMRQRKNAFAMMLFAQGTPMLLAGDEFGNSQNGNNNPYCQDNELSWVDWSGRRRDRELTEFVAQAIAYRQKHGCLHQERELTGSDMLSTGYPDLSFHAERAWYGDFGNIKRHLGCMYSGEYAKEKCFIYIAYNFHWETQEFALPLLPKEQAWYKVMDTSLKESFIAQEGQEKLPEMKSFTVPARTIVILEGR